MTGAAHRSNNSRSLLNTVAKPVTKMGRFMRRFPSRVAYCTPYWNSNTYATLLYRLISGSIVNGKDIDRLQEYLRQYFTVSEVLTYSSGRLALEIALKSVGVTADDEVLIPSFACEGVVQPVLECGAVPVFADIGEALNVTTDTIQHAISKRTRAVVVPHLFGNPAPVREITELCTHLGIKVIDDAAQAMGATFEGDVLGTYGDAGIVSFGNGKICFGTGGGILVTKRSAVAAQARVVELESSSATERAMNALYVLVMRKWRRWFFPLERLSFMHNKSSRATATAYSKHRMANLDAGIALSLLKTLDENIRSRRQRVCAYHELLGQDTRLRLVRHEQGSACLTQPIVMKGPNAKQVVDRLFSKFNDSGFEINKSYTPLHLKRKYQQFQKKPLPYTDQVWENILELPTEPSVSLHDVERISRIIISSL
jgi:perosamine synthetase